jgi:DinB superfamily
MAWMDATTFDLAEAKALLANTPAALEGLLRDLPPAWLECTEGPDTWSPHVVLGHLIEGELHDWMPRVQHVLEHGESVPFPPFDRFSQLRREPRTTAQLLAEFRALRTASLRDLAALRLGPAELARSARHPEFGRVTLQQHLATWVAHDLTHVTQIARVMAKRYTTAVGPWRAYLRVLRGE